MYMYWNTKYVAARAEFKTAMHLETPVVIFLSLSVWVKKVVRKLGRMGEVVGDTDIKDLLVPPKLVIKLYPLIEAYANHFRCDDGSSDGMISYYCGVASILSTQGFSIREVLAKYTMWAF